MKNLLGINILSIKRNGLTRQTAGRSSVELMEEGLSKGDTCCHLLNENKGLSSCPGEAYQLCINEFEGVSRQGLQSSIGKQKLVLSFTLNSSVQYKLGAYRLINQRLQQFNVVYKQNIEDLNCYSLDTGAKVMEIGFDLSYLQELEPDFPNIVGPVLKKIERSGSFYYYPRSLFITKEMDIIVSRLVSVLTSGCQRSYLMDYLVMDLLLKALSIDRSLGYEIYPFIILAQKEKQIKEVIDFALTDLHDYKPFEVYASSAAMSMTTLKKYMLKFTGISLKEH